MAKKPAPAAAQAQQPEGSDEVVQTSTDAGITEATEAQQPEGVVTTEAVDPATERAFPHSETDMRTLADVDAEIRAANQAEQPQNTPGYYMVVWHIKTGGKRYGPNEFVDLDDDAALPFLTSGAIVPAVKG